jgi:hypothetical protein
MYTLGERRRRCAYRKSERGKRIPELEGNVNTKKINSPYFSIYTKSRNLPSLEARVKENGREFGMR